jgi:2-dehydropantoate 2-reductase
MTVDFTPARHPARRTSSLCASRKEPGHAAKEIGACAQGRARLSFQNGVSNASACASCRVRNLQGWCRSTSRIWAAAGTRGTSGALIAEEHEVTQGLADRIGKGPAQLTLAKDMKAVAWGKLLINLNNAVNALSGETLLGQLGKRDYRRVVAASIVEALELLKAAGIEPAKIGPLPPQLLPHAIAAPDFIFKNLLLRVQKIDAEARSSMADDFAAGARDGDRLSQRRGGEARPVAGPGGTGEQRHRRTRQAARAGRRACVERRGAAEVCA